VDGVMSELVSYEMRPEDLSKEIAATVAAILEIVGKSIRPLSRMLSIFLKGFGQKILSLAETQSPQRGLRPQPNGSKTFLWVKLTTHFICSII
jgi:hypothetical protein